MHVRAHRDAHRLRETMTPHRDREQAEDRFARYYCRVRVRTVEKVASTAGTRVHVHKASLQGRRSAVARDCDGGGAHTGGDGIANAAQRAWRAVVGRVKEYRASDAIRRIGGRQTFVSGGVPVERGTGGRGARQGQHEYKMKQNL